MKTMEKIFWLICLSWVILSAWGPAVALGAEEPGGSLTIQEAIDTALREHPSLKESREKVEAARYGIGVSRAAYLPQLAFGTNVYYGDAFPATSGAPGAASPSVGSLSRKVTDYYANRFSLNQLIFDFGKTPGLIDQSRATFRQTQEDYSGKRQQVALDARSAYFGYLAAQRAVKVTQETVRQNQELVRQAQGFYKVGLKAKIDVTKAEANLYDAEANLIRVKNALDLARVTLMNALGLKSFPYREVQDVLEVTQQPLSLAELKAQGLQNRPEIQKNRYQLAYNEAALKVAKAGWFPTLTSTASYGWTGSTLPFDSSWWVGAGVTVPLFDGLLAYHNTRVAHANIRSTQASAEVLRQDVSKEVEQSFLDLKSSWELIRATKKAMEAARENYRLAHGRYQVGVGSIIEVTDAQVQFFQAELKFVQALYDYRINEAKLDKAIGKAF
jgi:TolC family type I secretion outer membrane protein